MMLFTSYPISVITFLQKRVFKQYLIVIDDLKGVKIVFALLTIVVIVYL